MARIPIDYGTTPGDGTGDVLFTSFEKINNNFIDLYGATGWAQYLDTVYTLASPFVVNAGVTATLPNNAGTVINTYLPIEVTALYNGVTNKFTPQTIGDYYDIAIRFKAKSSSVGGVFDFSLDLGGAIGLTFTETLTFAKGANVEQSFSLQIGCFSLNTFVANGGIPKITSVTGNTSFYGMNFQIVRTHRSV